MTKRSKRTLAVIALLAIILFAITWTTPTKDEPEAVEAFLATEEPIVEAPPAEPKPIEPQQVIASPPVVEPEPVEVKPDIPQQVEAPVESVCYTDDELFCMAATIYNEAGSNNCSDETRRLVGYVVLNRVKDSRYPNTIRGVLEQKDQYGRFYYTGIKFADRAKSTQEKEAVDRAYRIAAEVLETATIPIPSNVVFQAEFAQGISTYTYQDGIYFCCGKEVK